mmetsp:Transcript_16771/g.45846  ORF Transcript_16771/g.45846 Transcript_16771/m.45846 type:complete len:228 (-) Transcript_16771:99-782(-)
MSTADGFRPMSGPSFRTLHCSSIGSERRAISAEWSQPHWATNIAIGSPAAAAAIVSGRSVDWATPGAPITGMPGGPGMPGMDGAPGTPSAADAGTGGGSPEGGPGGATPKPTGAAPKGAAGAAGIGGAPAPCWNAMVAGGGPGAAAAGAKTLSTSARDFGAGEPLFGLELLEWLRVDDLLLLRLRLSFLASFSFSLRFSLSPFRSESLPLSLDLSFLLSRSFSFSLS